MLKLESSVPRQWQALKSVGCLHLQLGRESKGSGNSRR